jgi:hypothetical protein
MIQNKMAQEMWEDLARNWKGRIVEWKRRLDTFHQLTCMKQNQH